MLIPASPRIAASFASSPGRSGTSMSIWIMSPLPEDIALGGYKRCAPSCGGRSLMGCRVLTLPNSMRYTLTYVGIQVRDVERAYRELQAKGARSGHPPFPEGNSWLAYVQDPDGIWIELTGPIPGR